MKKKKQQQRDEQYVVKINRKKDDGYWIYGEEIDVWVPYREGEDFKALHHRAATMVKKMHPGCTIVSVTYA